MPGWQPEEQPEPSVTACALPKLRARPNQNTCRAKSGISSAWRQSRAAAAASAAPELGGWRALTPPDIAAARTARDARAARVMREGSADPPELPNRCTSRSCRPLPSSAAPLRGTAQRAGCSTRPPPPAPLSLRRIPLAATVTANGDGGSDGDGGGNGGDYSPPGVGLAEYGEAGSDVPVPVTEVCFAIPQEHDPEVGEFTEESADELVMTSYPGKVHCEVWDQGAARYGTATQPSGGAPQGGWNGVDARFLFQKMVRMLSCLVLLSMPRKMFWFLVGSDMFWVGIALRALFAVDLYLHSWRGMKWWSCCKRGYNSKVNTGPGFTRPGNQEFHRHAYI